MSPRNKIDTFLPQAPARNMSALQRECPLPPAEILGGTGKNIPERLGYAALYKQDKFREEHQAGKLVPIEEITAIEARSRSDLILEAARLFQAHAVPEVGDKETMRHASLAGCGVVMAFIDLAAQMQAKQDIPYDAAFFRDAMHRSTKTLLTMAATSHEADGVFMFNACTWSPDEISRLSDVELYKDLYLKPSFFEMDAEGTLSIRSDEQTRQNIRRSSGKKYDFQARKTDIMFGCPFRPGIVKLHTAMTEASISNHLVERHWLTLAQEEL